MAKEATKSFVLRVDAVTMEAVERWAADEFRSTNGQLQWIIMEALRRAFSLAEDAEIRNRIIPLVQALLTRIFIKDFTVILR